MKKLDKIEIMGKSYELLKDRIYESDIINITNEFKKFLISNENFTGEDLQKFWTCLAEDTEIDYIDIVELFTLYMADIVEW